jgi:hypothetical protein
MIETRSNSAIRFQWWSDGSSSSDITSANNSVPGSQWNHIAMVKNNDTITGYVNGVAVGIDPTAGSIYENTDDPLRIGILNAAEDQDFNGYLQDLRIYKGVAKYKGGFDVPKPYTPVGIESWRAVPDTTANNFATWNAVDRNSGTLTNGNLTFTDDGSDGWNNSRATIGVSTGKYYWEMRADAVVNAVLCASIAGPNGNDSTKGARLGFLPGQTDDAGVTYYASGYLYHADNQSGGSAWGDSYTNGDIISIAVDMNDSGGKVWFAKNGTWQVSGNPSTGANAARSDLKTYADTWFPISGTYYSISAQTFNFGQNPTFSGNTTAGTFTDSNSKGLFKYQPPSGFLALCEDNLPTPAISDPGEYFRTVLYTGSQTARSIQGLGFKPDLVWIKARSEVSSNALYDSVRGPTLGLFSNRTDAEETDTNNLTSFDDDGFSLGTGYSSTGVNGSGRTYVAWCWRAGAGTTSTNTNGSITSVVSVNQDAGFSIVSYTGTSGATVGHGLGKTPEFYHCKKRSIKQIGMCAHSVYHKSLGATNKCMVKFNGANTSSAYWNNTEPTSSLFSLGNEV